jgi:hypothetical protein
VDVFLQVGASTSSEKITAVLEQEEMLESFMTNWPNFTERSKKKY